ncbi:MAG TPA: ABC transporter ATP-binding protein [Stellaceae bacterium]|nr:ABC transporter ATP-binding protein [Stellaceae bacterium]
MTGASIALADCGKTFADGTVALHRLDLEIAGGETVVLLGPSGCGKTTLLRLIAGLESPDPGGRVRFGGEDVTARPIERRNVGMVFQSYALFPNMTVEENVAYGLKVRRVPPKERARRTAEMLEMMHIGALRRRRVDQLSGGQRQRVALARAIAVRPTVLLLDEPLTALDALLRERLRVEIDALLRGLGITAIYVTHDQAEAMALGDRIVVMREGRVAQIGTPRDVYFRPANPFVADFIGTINRLVGVARNGAVEMPGGRFSWRADAAGPVELLFRPESARLLPPEGAPLRGRVASALFMGDRTRLVIAGIGETPIIVDTTERRQFHAGEEVGIGLDPEGLFTLAEAAAPDPQPREGAAERVTA